MDERHLTIDGVRVPRFLYGTAWKEDETRRLTGLALGQGFRGIDTANQRKHYVEAAVGEGVRDAIEGGDVAADDLFLQTKFTFRRGQDHRLPYDPKVSIQRQVEQSFESSLDHLKTDAIDSLVLHGPMKRSGLTAIDRATWQAMEAIHESGRVRLLGISNIAVEQVALLCREARVAPRFVQNRCYAVRGWDRQMRAFCADNEIVYQGFSLLTANRQLAAHPEMARIADRHGRSVSQVIFRFALDVGMIPLTGTTNADHMRQDLAVFDFGLDPGEVETIEGLAVGDGTAVRDS